MDEEKKTPNPEGDQDEHKKPANSHNTGNKNGSQRKGGKRRKDGRRRDAGDQRGKDGLPWKNDWHYYAPSEQIVKDIASLPFSRLPGLTWSLPKRYGADHNIGTVQPSVMSIDYVMMPGQSNNPSSAINMAGKRLFTYIRRKNSGAANYEAADLLMYILAMREIYAKYFQVKRAIGVASGFYMQNRSIPAALFQAMGINYDGVPDQIAQLRGRANLIAQKINSFAVPKYFKVFERDAYVSSFIFADARGERAQFYVFHSQYYRVWDPTGSTAGTQLNTKSLGGTTSIGAMLDAIDEMLDALFYDSDANIIAGDTLKAFADSDLYKVQEIPDDYIILPVFDEDILMQIHNLNFFPVRLDSTYLTQQLNITQEAGSGGVLLTNVTSQTLDADTSGFFFDSMKDDVTPTDILEWSRLMCGARSSASKDVTYGLELVLGFNIHYTRGSSSSHSYWVTLPISTMLCEPASIPGATTNSPAFYVSTVNSIALLTNFDWAPMLKFYPGDNDANDIMVDGVDCKPIIPIGDIQKLTIIDFSTVKTINDNAVYAAFNSDNLFIKQGPTK